MIYSALFNKDLLKERFKDFLSKKNITPYEFAKQTGVKHQTLGNNIKNVNFKWDYIARASKVYPDLLTVFIQDLPSPDIIYQQKMGKLPKAPQEQIKNLKDKVQLLTELSQYQRQIIDTYINKE